MEQKTDHFGKVSGEFSELEYDTEYLLDVRQHVMLSSEAQSLLDNPISLRTAAKPVEPEPEPEPLVNSIAIYRNIDPMGGETYSAKINKQTDIPAYDSYFIGFMETEMVKPADDSNPTSQGDGGDIIYPDDDEGRDGFIEWSYQSEIFTALPTDEVSINVYGEQLSGSSYTAALVGVDAQEEQTVIFSTEIASSSFISKQNITEKQLYINRIITYSGEISYHAYFALPGEDVYNITAYLADPNDDTHSAITRIGLEKANDEEEITLDFSQAADYDDFDPYDFFISYDNNSLPAQYIDLNTIPTKHVEDDPSSFTMYQMVDPMDGTYYYTELDYNGYLPSYTSYGVWLRGKNSQDDPGTGDWIESPYDFSVTGMQPLYTGGVLESPYYDVALVGYDEPANFEIIYSETVKPADFNVIGCELNYNRVFFQKGYDSTLEEEHTFIFLNVPEGESYTRISVTIKDPKDEQTSANIQSVELNTKWEISSFEQLGLDPNGTYQVTVEAVTSQTTGFTEIIIDETVDFGLIPYYVYASPHFDEANFSIARGGNNYTTAFIHMTYDDCGYWSDFQITFYVNGDYDNPYDTKEIKSFEFNNVEKYYIDNFNVEEEGYNYFDFTITAFSTDPMNSGRIDVYKYGEFSLYLMDSEDITSSLDGIVAVDSYYDEDQQINFLTVGVTFNDLDLVESITEVEVQFENIYDGTDSFSVDTTDNISAQTYIDPQLDLDDYAGKTYYVSTYAYIDGVRTSLYIQIVSLSV